MENPAAGDSSAAAGKGTAADDSGTSAAAGGSARTGTPGWAGQSPDDASRLARAALQGTPLFTGSAAGGGPGGPAQQGDVSGPLLDPMQAAQQLTSDQLAAMLSTGGYTATALGSLGTAGLQAADNAAALNALLLGGGINLNHLGTAGLQLAGLGADLSSLGALVGADPSDLDDHHQGGGAGSKSAGGSMGVTNNKQLSSRFRGVCWNKKNKRWQAAINSSGKYLYLGSFTNEDDAAHHFDRAAIKLRGKKAKLNFDYADYVDENGELLDDIILPQGATGCKDDANRGGSAGGGGSGRRGSKSAAAAAAAAADAAGLAGYGFDADFVNQAALAALMQQGAWQTVPRGGRTTVLAAPLPLEKEQVSVLLPPGCALEYIVSVQQDGSGGDGSGATSSGGGAVGSSSSSKSLFGVVYREGGSGLWGAGVWTGYMLKAFGFYSTEGEAAQTARCAGELLSEDRDLRVSGGVANQQGIGLMAAAAPGGLLTGPAAAATAAYSQDALALAGLAAGLGGSGSGAGAAARGGVGANGLLGVGPGGLVGAGGIGGLANVSLAQAAQLAQQAAAEQGLPMSYPPLSVALPAATSALQLLPGATGSAGGSGSDAAAAGGLDVAAAAAKACSEAEMQQLMQQLMQQQQQQLPGVAQQQQQLGAGGDGLLKLANLDMSHLRQQLMEQQQGAGAEADLQPQQQQAAQGREGVLGSIPSLDTGVGEKRGLEEGAEGADAAAAAVGGDVGGEHAPKRIKLEGAPADAAGAGAAPVPGGLMAAAGGGGTGGDMAQMDLQDALKMLRSVQQQAQAPAQE